MRYEISAGGIVVKKEKSALFLLLIKDKNDNWTFPKGLIENKEKSAEAAVREVSEETGINNLKLLKELTPIQYWYKYENELIKKTVHYFLFFYEGKEIPQAQAEEGIKEVKWFEENDALNKIGYRKTNVDLILEAKEKLA